MLGIGLIGLGKHGSRYAHHIVKDLRDAALVAVCRRNRPEGEKLAAASGCAFYDDYHDLVANSRVDTVVVAVPPTLHPAIVEAACRAGKPLLVEKPLATSLAEARHIASMVSASGVRAMVAHTLRFNSTVQTVQAHVPEIGPLHALYLSQRFEPFPARLARPAHGERRRNCAKYRRPQLRPAPLPHRMRGHPGLVPDSADHHARNRR